MGTTLMNDCSVAFQKISAPRALGGDVNKHAHFHGRKYVHRVRNISTCINLSRAQLRNDEEQRSVKLSLKTKKKQALTKKATPAGFEPARAEPNGLAGHRLNHSAKVSSDRSKTD